MQIKKNKGKIFGAAMSSSEKKAMEMEIRRQLAEFDRKHVLEIDASVLWTLHDVFGFGPKRLKQFYDNFSSSIDSLLDQYEMDDCDYIWLCTKKLKEYGIDIEEWDKERMK